MNIIDAANILAEMAEQYPDYRLSVYVDGAHHTNKILFYAIAPSVDYGYKYVKKEEKKAFADMSSAEQFELINDLTRQYNANVTYEIARKRPR